MNWRELLSAQGTAVVPTDTVYGLICDACDAEAVARVFKIKGRPEGKAMPVFVADIDMAKKVAEVDSMMECFLKSVWPGSVSVVLKVRPGTPLAMHVYASDGTVAVRVPKHPVITEIFRQFPHPIVGTSANVSGQGASGNFVEVAKQWPDNEPVRPDVILNYGILPVSAPSTIVKQSARGRKLELLRAGAVEFEKLSALWNECLA